MRCGADIKALRAVLRLAGGIGARADRLRLERFKRPILAHFPRNDALDIVLHVHDVDDVDRAARHALVFKTAVVAIAAKPRDCLLPCLDGADAQRIKAALVELKEDGARLRGNDRHPCAAAAGDRAARTERVERALRAAVVAVIAHADHERAVVVGYKAAVLRRTRRGERIVVKRLCKLDVIALIPYHGDLLIARGQRRKLHKIAGAVVISQRIAAKGRVIL